MKNQKLIDFRKDLGMTQKDFADTFEIPLGTLRNWEQGLSSMPVVVWNLMLKVRSLENKVEILENIIKGN